MKVKNFVKAFLLRCFILLCLSLFRNIWERLRDLGIIRDTDTFEAYVNADSEAEVAGTPTDDEIVAEIIEVETTLDPSISEASDDDDIIQPVPTASQAHDACHTLRAYLQSYAGNDGALVALNDIENTLLMKRFKQLTLDDFFSHI